MFDRLISSVVKNRVLILLLMAVLVGWGIYSWRQVPVDAYPELTNNQVQILTRVPGMSPVEVEKLVTYPIEISMTNLEGVQDNRSLSQFGLSVVTIVFEEDMDPYFVRRLVSQRLNQVKEDLPEKAEPSLGPLSTALGQVYQYALVDKAGDGRTYSARELRTMQDWILAPELRTVEGVVEANALGGFVKQYHVRFDPEQLVNYDLSLDEVYEALRSSNQNSGGNYIVRNDQQYVVRGVGRLGSNGGGAAGLKRGRHHRGPQEHRHHQPRRHAHPRERRGRGEGRPRRAARGRLRERAGRDRRRHRDDAARGQRPEGGEQRAGQDGGFEAGAAAGGGRGGLLQPK